MSFPFSPIGTSIYVVYVILVLAVIVFPLRKWVLKDKAWKGRLITIIAFLLLSAPIAEEFWIQYQFKTACQDAGIHVTRKVEAEGYLNATGSSVSSKLIKKGRLRKEKSEFEILGYRFKESLAADGKIVHLERKHNHMYVTILDEPVARYHLRHTHDHFLVGHQLEKFERDIFDSLNKEVISRDTSYARYTSWIEGLWIRFLGSGQQICRGPLDEPEKQSRIVPFLTRSIAPKSKSLEKSRMLNVNKNR